MICKIIMKVILAICLSLAISLCQDKMNLVLLDDPSAICLDGSPGAYYYVRGSDPSTIVLYFEGGGWCGDRDLSSTIENCYQRSKTNYGSSKHYPSTVSYSDGILSDSEYNSYRNATRVILRYCDGAGHQGTKSSPIQYKDTKLYFRGNNITIAQLQDLQSREGLFSKATNIIVTGGSAGGLAAFLWADYIKLKASTPNVFSVPDSGIFLDFPTFQKHQSLYSNQFQNLFKLSNSEIDPPIEACARKYGVDKYKCMMVEYMLQFINTPTFVIQSLYDTWSIQNILDINCTTGSSLAKCSQQQMAYIQLYHMKTKKVIQEIMKQSQNGVWAPVCATHGFLHVSRYYNANYRIPMSSINSIDYCVASWVNKKNETHNFIDEGVWPANQPCSGIGFASEI